MVASLTPHDIALRLALTAVAGIIIGLEREIRGRSAGLRTTLLACLAAAMGMILAEALFGDPLIDSRAHHDAISRVIQGIVTGIGFLGAGAITREQRMVHGLTTAALMWMATILGLLLGAGHWQLGFTGVGLTMFTLVGLRYAEVYLPRDRFGCLTVTVHANGASDAELKERVAAAGAEVSHFSLEHDLENRQRTLKCDVRYRHPFAFDVVERIVKSVGECRGVICVNWTTG